MRFGTDCCSARVVEYLRIEKGVSLDNFIRPYTLWLFSDKFYLKFSVLIPSA